MKRLLILILAGIFLVSVASGEKQMVIGAIIDESGDTASYAPGIDAAINLAASDLNDYYKKVNKTTTVVIKKEYTDGTSESAAKAAENLVSQGAQIIVDKSFHLIIFYVRFSNSNLHQLSFGKMSLVHQIHLFLMFFNMNKQIL